MKIKTAIAAATMLSRKGYNVKIGSDNSLSIFAVKNKAEFENDIIEEYEEDESSVSSVSKKSKS